ncbi:MAG: hypothetical protein P4L27_00610 [Ignavibacteriaceae bacterium]|nr:hypothetical protein [Ignavibacteriaceae bacterium]
MNIDSNRIGDIRIGPQNVRGEINSLFLALFDPCIIRLDPPNSQSQNECDIPNIQQYYSLINFTGKIFSVDDKKINYKVENFYSDPDMEMKSLKSLPFV